MSIRDIAGHDNRPSRSRGCHIPAIRLCQGCPVDMMRRLKRAIEDVTGWIPVVRGVGIVCHAAATTDRLHSSDDRSDEGAASGHAGIAAAGVKP